MTNKQKALEAAVEQYRSEVVSRFTEALYVVGVPAHKVNEVLIDFDRESTKRIVAAYLNELES